MGTRDSVQLAKLSRPRLHHPIRRDRLFELLDQRENHPVIWVSGPPGSGKTTLVASYLEARKAHTFWLRLDEGDCDSATLFSYLIELARQAGRGSGSVLPYFTPGCEHEPVAFSRNFFRRFFSAIGPKAVLVLEDHQEAASPLLDQILRQACGEIPPGANLVVISRTAHTGELARFVANGQLLSIEWDQLRLTLREVEQILAERGVARPRDAKAWLAHCDGWIAGLVLMTAHGRRNGPAAGDRPGAAEECLFDYFVNEIFGHADAKLRTVLMRTAVFVEVTPAMAVEITGVRDAEHLLAELYRRQCFIHRTAQGELTYRYHELFRTFLLDRLRRTLDSSGWQELLIAAGRILEARAWISEAAELYIEGKAWGNLAQVVKRHAGDFLSQGRWQTVDHWLTTMPQPMCHSDPWLGYWLAVVQVRCVPARALETLQGVLCQFSRSGEVDGQFRAICLLQDVTFFLGGSLRAFDQWIDLCERLFEAKPCFESTDLGAEAWVGYLTMVFFRSGSGRFVDRGIAWLAEHHASDELSSPKQVYATQALLSHAILAGDHEKSSATYERLRALLEQKDLPPLANLYPRLWLGLYPFFNGEYRAARAHFTELYRLAERYANPAVSLVAQVYCAACHCQLHELPQARLLLDAVRRRYDSRMTHVAANLHWAHSLYAACSGDTQGALGQQAQSTALWKQAGFAVGEHRARVMLAVRLIDLGRSGEALDELAHAREGIGATLCRYLDALMFLVEAKAWKALGDGRRFREALHRAIASTDNPALAGILSWVAAWLPELLGDAVQHGIEVQRARGLIRKLGVKPLSQLEAAWPWPIRIYALDGFRVVIDDVEIAAKGKAHFKVFELLKALLALGPHAVSVDTIAMWLWPDAEGDAAQGNLRTCLHRLRKLLRHGECVGFHDGKVQLNPTICWVDAWAFDARPAPRSLSMPPAEIPALRASLRHYRGRFLQEETYPWVYPIQERLHAKFLRQACAVGDALRADRDWAAAALFYEECLDIDPAAEVLYRRLMLCLQACGRGLEAAEAYERCRQTLVNSSLIGPSAETTAIYRSLAGR